MTDSHDNDRQAEVASSPRQDAFESVAAALTAIDFTDGRVWVDDFADVALNAAVCEIAKALRSLSPEDCLRLLDGAFIGDTGKLFAGFIEREFGASS